MRFNTIPWVEVISTIGAVATIIAYAYAVSILLRKVSQRREKERDRFFKALTEGLKVEAIKSLEDVENIYKGVGRFISDDSINPSRLSKWLREYLVELYETSEKENDAKRLKWKELITQFIDQNEQQSPYASLPELERSIITDIEVFLKAQDNKAVERKLGEITTAIQAREESFLKLRSTTRWSVPLAVIGLILTIIFGLISIIK